MRPPSALKRDVVPCNVETMESAAVQIRGKTTRKETGQSLPACLVESGLVMDGLSVVRFCLYGFTGTHNLYWTDFYFT